MSKELKGFITYSHEDAAAKDELRKRLAVMEQKNEFTTWHDGEITAGDEWYKDISKNLAEADILLYLVSAASLASKNCNKELAEALKRDIKVIPIILEHCDWMHHQLRDFEVLPLKGKPITKWPDQSEGWQNVVDGIRETINKILSHADSAPYISREKIIAESVFQRGNFLMMLGQTGTAIEAYTDAIELNSRHGAAYNNRSVAYHTLNQLDLAFEDVTTAITLNQCDVCAHNNRGLIYFSKGDFDLAIRDFNNGIRLNPNFALAYLNRGVLYEEKGEVDRAIKDWNEATRLDPDCIDAYYNRGTAYGKKGEVV